MAYILTLKDRIQLREQLKLGTLEQYQRNENIISQMIKKLKVHD